MTFEQIDKLGGLACAFLFAVWIARQFISGKAVAGDILERERRRSEAAETRERETSERFDHALSLTEQGMSAAEKKINELTQRNQLLESEIRRSRKQ